MPKTVPQLRLRLKANGHIVELLADGREREIEPEPPGGPDRSATVDEVDAAYARSIRARTRLTQAEFAARIGVPIETVRNWEQGKRSPRGPARALLKVIEAAPDLAFAALSKAQPR
jgi:putative transcriptional regulator